MKPKFRFVGNDADCSRLAKRYAAIAMAEALRAMGTPAFLADVRAAREFKVSPRTVRHWRRRVFGIATGDVALRLKHLSWHSFEVVRNSDAR